MKRKTTTISEVVKLPDQRSVETIDRQVGVCGYPTTLGQNCSLPKGHVGRHGKAPTPANSLVYQTFVPIRWVWIRNNFVGLGRSETDLMFYIARYSSEGLVLVTKEGIRSPKIAHLRFEEICHEMSKTYKSWALEMHKSRGEYDQDEVVNTVLEAARLEMADDGRLNALREKAQELTEDERDAFITETLAAYNRQKRHEAE